MASLYRRTGSPFWWIKFRNPQTGELCRESTGLRHDDYYQNRQAVELEAEKTLAERRLSPGRADHWDHWADAYVSERHPPSSASGVCWQNRWRNLRAFFRATEIHGPRQLNRSHIEAYIAWRRVKHPGVKPAHRNTAIEDLRTLSAILNEAVRRGIVHANPIAPLKLRYDRRREKPELTDAELQLVSDAIERERHHRHYLLLRRSFDIARWQGCRLNETALDVQRDITLQRDPGGSLTGGIIRLRIKGGRDHVTAIHDRLLTYFGDLQQSGVRETFTPPVNRHGLPTTSLIWSEFIRRHRLKQLIPGFTFHCLRVTVASRAARSHVPEYVTMRYLGHASTTIHRAYQRFKLADLQPVMRAISGDTPPTP